MSSKSHLALGTFLCLALPGLATGIATPSCAAQEYRGTVSGTVLDAGGAIIPGAKVTIVGPQQTYNATSKANGEFVVPFIDLGTYTVSVSAPGFSTESQVDVHVDVSSKVALSFHLKAGATSDTITVTDSSAGVNTSDASLGTVLDPEKIQNLPLNGRQLYSLLGLTPGTRFTQTQFGPGGYSGTRAWDQSNAYQINGQSGNQNQFSLNGAPVSVQGGGGSGTWNVAPTIDAVEEFKIMTNTYDAQYGRETGGTVNTVMKSGNDAYHGTVYDFWRNSVLDANTYQLNQEDAAKPFHNQHQFGGTVGGYAWRKHTYFFFSFEGWREVLPVGVVTGVATADMLPGADGSVNLTNYLAATSGHNIYDSSTTHCVVPGQNPCQAYTRDQFANNTIPASRISPIGLAFLKLLPKPNVVGDVYSNNYVAADPGRYTYNQPMVRVDHNFSDRTRAYGMFVYFGGQEYRNGSGLPAAISQGDINNHRQTFTSVFDVTHTFSPSRVLDVRVAWNRSVNKDPDGGAGAGLAPSSFTAESLGLQMPVIPTSSAQLPPEINMYNCCTANFIGNHLSADAKFETYDLGISQNQTFGPHSLHYGFEGMLFRDVPSGIGSPNGQFTFAQQYTQQDPYHNIGDGDGIAAILLGLPDNGSVDWFDSRYESYKYLAGFIQDDWKARKNLTFNFGLRWETETSPTDRNNELTAGFCLTCINPLGTSVNGAGGVPNPLLGGIQFASGNYTAYKNFIGDFLPKIGVSFAVTPKIVIRGGFGLATGMGIELGGQSSWQQTTNYAASLNGGQTPSGYFNTGTPYPTGAIAPPGNVPGLLTEVGNGVGFDQRNRKIPLVKQYSFGIQGAGPANTVYDLEYVGNVTTRLRVGTQLNSLTPAQFAQGHSDKGAYLNNQVANPFYGKVDPASDLGQSPTISQGQLLTPFPEFSSLYDYNVPIGYSDYNALQAKLERRISNPGSVIGGLSVLASFTYSKTFDATGLLNNGEAGLVDSAPYYAVDGSDRPYDFALSGLYTLPFGKGAALLNNTGRLTSQLISRWQFDWIFQNSGGTPIGVPNQYTYACGASYDIRPIGHHTYKSWLNNSDNVQAASNGGSANCLVGFSPYTATSILPITSRVRSPFSQQTQIGLEKRISLYRESELQFKAEAFNVTNTPIFGGPNTGNVNDPLTRNSQVINPNDPGAWSGYGTIGGTQQNFPRQLQLSLKVLF